MAKKSIKIYEGVRVNANHKVINLKYIPDIWNLFKWDIKNDKNAKECADLITRELLMFGYIDLTDLNQGKMLIVELLPVKD